MPHAVFGIIAIDGVVVEAAPIAHWTVGKAARWVKDYYRRRFNRRCHIMEWTDGNKSWQEV